MGVILGAWFSPLDPADASEIKSLARGRNPTEDRLMLTAFVLTFLGLMLTVGGTGGVLAGWRGSWRLLATIAGLGIIPAATGGIAILGIDASHGWPPSPHDNADMVYGMMMVWVGGAMWIATALTAALIGWIFKLAGVPGVKSPPAPP